MIYNLTVNQKMCVDEKISGNAGVVFSVIQTMMSLSYMRKITIDEEIYVNLHTSLILEQIPVFFKSRATLWRAMDELINAGLIKSNNNTKFPAFALTAKCDKYISNLKFDNSKATLPQKNKPLFALQKLTRVEDLTVEYRELLKKHAMTICQREGIPEGEYSAFIDYHSSKGNRFKNYISAFRTWVRNYKKFNSNDGEKNMGLYQ